MKMYWKLLESTQVELEDGVLLMNIGSIDIHMKMNIMHFAASSSSSFSQQKQQQEQLMKQQRPLEKETVKEEKKKYNKFYFPHLLTKLKSI